MYIPPPTADQFVATIQDFARLVARLFKCKLTIRADYADGTFIVHESDHREKP